MKLTKRQKQCIQALEVLKKATAREVALYMYSEGLSVVFERNLAHPRLNELMNEGIVKVVDYKIDQITGKEVSVYQLKEVI